MSEQAVQFDEEPVEAQEAPQEAEETTEETTEQPTEEASEETSEESQEPARVEFTPEQQAFINEKIVGRKVAQLRETERRAQELEQRLQEMQSQAPQQPAEGPQVPPVPDVWDADYEKKIEERDNAILERARWEESQRITKEREEYEQRQAHEKQMEEMGKRVMTYTERAKGLGIAEDELQVAGNAVSQFGVPDPLVDYILDHEQGPALTMYLAQNLADLQQIQSMNPIHAAVYIEKNLAPKVSRSIKRKAPPEPVEGVKGSGMPEKNRGPKGAVFE